MAGGVSYPLQLSSVTENHAALYEESLKHPEQFWGDLARRRLRWIKEFDQVMDCDMSSGQFKWFLGGVINVSGEDEHIALVPFVVLTATTCDVIHTTLLFINSHLRELLRPSCRGKFRQAGLHLGEG